METSRNPKCNDLTYSMHVHSQKVESLYPSCVLVSYWFSPTHFATIVEGRNCYWVVLFIFFCALNSCSEGMKKDNSEAYSDYSLIQRDTLVSLLLDNEDGLKFVPDTSICDVYLDSYTSIERGVGDIMGDSMAKVNGYEVYYFSNIDTSEYLKMIFFPGGRKNSFNRFVISEVDYRPINRRLNIVKCSVFVTESKIKLGITLNDLKRIKGVDYLKIKKDSFDVYVYSIKISDKSLFYARYKMPVYSAIYKFQDNKLVEFEFGFENP